MNAQPKTQDPSPNTHSFSADVSRLLDIVAHALYTNHDVFLRELISNSADACDRLRYAAIEKPELTADNPQFRIHIYKDTDARTLTVVDNGIGMSKSELIDHLGTIAKSGTAALMEKMKAGEKSGGVSGAVVGGLLGSKVGGGSGQLWATGAGALLGAFIGSEIGASLDKADRVMLGQANQRAQTAPIGESVSWNNPESGNYGTVTPVRDGQSSYGRYCREYEQMIYVGGRQETAVGTACKNDDGTWEVVS